MKPEHIKRNTFDLPSGLEHRQNIFRQIENKTVVVFLDYDGTLTPIVERPDLPTLPEYTKETLKQLTDTHGLLVPYQMGAMRPIPEMGNYKSPIINVYLCGSGSHPGAGGTMAPGRNAAQIIYQDLAFDFTNTFYIQ